VSLLHYTTVAKCWTFFARKTQFSRARSKAGQGNSAGLFKPDACRKVQPEGNTVSRKRRPKSIAPEPVAETASSNPLFAPIPPVLLHRVSASPCPHWSFGLRLCLAAREPSAQLPTCKQYAVKSCIRNMHL